MSAALDRQRGWEQVTITDLDGEPLEARIVTEPDETFARVYLDGALYIGSIGHNAFGWDYRTAGQSYWYSVGGDRQEALEVLWREYSQAHGLTPAVAS